MAGLPEAVIARAEDVLQALEEKDKANDTEKSRAGKLADRLPLFTAPPSTPPQPLMPPALEKLLTSVKPDELSPKDALDILYRIKAALP